MEQTKHVDETPKSIITLLNQLIIEPSTTEEQLRNVFSRLSGMTISEFHATQAFHLVFDWKEFVDCSTKDILDDIIRPMFEGMGCKVVSISDYESIL